MSRLNRYRNAKYLGIYYGVFEISSMCFLNVFAPNVYYNVRYYYRFNPSAAAVAYGMHNEFAANPTKLRMPPTLPPPPPPTHQPPTAVATTTSAASMGYHQPPTSAVNRWTEFGKATTASTSAVDFPAASYFNNNLL